MPPLWLRAGKSTSSGFVTCCQSISNVIFIITVPALGWCHEVETLPMVCPQVFVPLVAIQVHASSCVDDTEQLALQLSSFAGYSGESEALTQQLVLCHALEVTGQLCLRVNSIPSYMEGNRVVGIRCGVSEGHEPPSASPALPLPDGVSPQPTDCWLNWKIKGEGNGRE